MKNSSIDSQNWEDVVFTNRNLGYGAYRLRKEYDTRLMKSFGITLGVCCLLLLFSFKTNDSTKKPISMTSEKDSCRLIILDPPPVIEINEPSVPLAPQTKKIPIKGHFHITEQTIIPPIDDYAVNNQPEPTIGNESITTNPTTGYIVPSLGTEVNEASKPFISAEVMPKFGKKEGDLARFFARHYHIKTNGEEISGIIYVSLVVTSTGEVDMVEIIKGLDKDNNDEAVRVVKMMKWSAGVQNGRNVAVRFVIPIRIKA